MPNTNRTSSFKRIKKTSPKYIALLCCLFFIHHSLLFAQTLSSSPWNSPLASNQKPVPEQDALVNVRIDTKVFWDVEAKLDESSVFIKASSLSDMFEPYLSNNYFNSLFKVLFSNLEWIGPQDLQLAGINSNWVLASLTYEIILPTQLMTKHEIDFNSTSTQNNIVEHFKPSLFAAVLNLNADANAYLSETAKSISASQTLDSLFKIYDLAIETGGTFTQGNSVFGAALNKARVVYDIPSIQGRAIAGKIPAAGISFQSRPELLGISLSSIEDFSKYDNINSPAIAFSLEQASTVRVLLNGRSIRILQLERGQYRIFDIPFSSGLNMIELQVIDPTGQEKWLRPLQGYIAAESGILVGGESQYGISAGVGYQEPDQLFVSAFLRKGLDYRATVSAFSQIDNRSVLVGGAAIAGLPIGVLSSEIAAVLAWDDRPEAITYAGNLSYRLAIPSIKSVPSFSLNGEFRSQGFHLPNPTSADIVSPNTTLSSSFSLFGLISKNSNYSFSLSWQRTFASPVNDTFTGGASFGFSPKPGISLSANASISVNSANKISGFSYIMASIVPSGRNSARLSFLEQGKGTNAISYSDTIPLFGGMKFNIQGNNLPGGVNEKSTVSASIEKESSIGSVSVLGNVGFGGSSKNLESSAILRMDSALAFADGVFAISKPLYDSFILLVPNSSITDQDALLTVFGSGNVLSKNGRAVAVSIPSYTTTVAHADFPNSPADTIATVESSGITTKYRSGIAYKFGIKKQLSISGKLVNDLGKPYPFIIGDIIDSEGSFVESIFTYEDGTFMAYSISPGTFIIQWRSELGSTKISIPEDAEGTIEVGNLIVGKSKE